MTRFRLVRGSLPALVGTTVLLAGCGWFHRDQVAYYKGAAESRPLEVPPDLDAPNTSKELVVPGSAAAAPRATAASSSAMATPSAMPPVASAPAGVVADASSLHVADSVDNTWQRVGLALERSQLGKVSSKDEAARSYAFAFEGQVAASDAPAAEHHWYTRVLHPFGGGDSAKAPVVKSTLHISVSDDAGGARVNVSGDDAQSAAAARRLLDTLRERLS